MPGNTCGTCGNWKNKGAKQCKACSNETIRQKLKGRPHSDERRDHISAARKAQYAAGYVNHGQIAYMRGRPSWRALPVGSTRVDNGHIKIKCEDGEWRYRARVMWAEAHGPIPDGLMVHHKNEDPFDDRLENFELLTRSEHIAAHAKTRDQAGRMRAARAVKRAARGLPMKGS